MRQSEAKVVKFADYKKARANWTHEDIKKILIDQKMGLRRVELHVVDLRGRHHRLNDIQKANKASARIEKHLIQVSHWLDDKSAATNNLTQTEALMELSKQCKDLRSDNELIRKSIADDMAACRHSENKESVNWVQACGSVITIVTAAVLLVKAHPHNKQVEQLHITPVGAGEMAGLAGASVVLRYQIYSGFRAVGRSIAATASKLSEMKHEARFSAVAMGLTVAVATKEQSDITPRRVVGNSGSAKFYYSAKL